MTALAFVPGDRVAHPEFGTGVVLEAPRDGFVRAFFGLGERRIPAQALRRERSRAERILSNVSADPARAATAWAAWQAHALPLLESAAALTSAKIDLLPHQVVLTHRVATSAPRRFLIADEVGLGKTIETALILRELASRGELPRALMIVPAGLVNNWHRELNEVFHLDFEVFGSEGDVTDRKSNAFAKHDRLIASIDTLKRPTRVRRLLEAPKWDLIVFDEAHHLTAVKSGGRVRKTENYKLAEALRGHARDMLLLSATPHQGDHFPFWMLIQLLNPTLFNSPEEMVEQRHRLNAVIFRRTKADACKPDGSPLFARRLVHTESFLMGDGERAFYEHLQAYLRDGFDLAKRQGGKGQALGFLMAIFQKIAASSFAAVRRTLRRRLLALTIHEGVLHDQELDVDGRESLFAEARSLIHEDFSLRHDAMGRGEADRVFADLKYRVLRKIDDDELASVGDPDASEVNADSAEDFAGALVKVHLPEERQRIRDLLQAFPGVRETKVEKLLTALGTLWRRNPQEKVVIFATYLGTVDLLSSQIEAAYPGQGVVVLRGGDHGAKLAAERRFRKPDGPRVLVCTAAGREGINLQFARILFNFDLPWNPMDVEQRIGRIHRYGQRDTAQVYNLILSDTIEGRIFLLLDEKLSAIVGALGKVDDQGNVAEDLRTQILGQLAEKLNYERLYQQALADPELKRTKVELEAALANASEARQVVFQLFQDLEGFSLDDYRPFADVTADLDALRAFLQATLPPRGMILTEIADGLLEVRGEAGALVTRFTTNRDDANAENGPDLLGLDHPLVADLLAEHRATPPENIGFAVAAGEATTRGVITCWLINARMPKGEQRVFLQPIAIRDDGQRIPPWERQLDRHLHGVAAPSRWTEGERLARLRDQIEPALDRELGQRGVLNGDAAYTAELIVWVELV
jgi:SNF2-related domain/Helicase conserved C-terminal domain